MKADLWLLAFFGLANASALIKRNGEVTDVASIQGAGYDPGYDEKPEYEPEYPEEKPEYKPEYPEEKPEYKPEYPEEKPEYKPEYPEEKPKYEPKYPEKVDYEPKYPEKPEYEPKYPEEKPEYKPEYPEKESGKYPEKYPEWDDEKHDWDDKHDYYKDKHWKPKTNHPEFFSLKVDEKCDNDLEVIDDIDAENSCYFDSYAIRLERGIVIATPYNKWWDPKLPIFFVDSDTQLYTVSKKPLQLYIDAITGSLRYAPVGWLAPNAISLSFYKFGNNPIAKVDPSPAYLSWPSTLGMVGGALAKPDEIPAVDPAKPWWLCPLGKTGQFQVYVNVDNFGDSGSSGVWKDYTKCKQKNLAAINANPWKQKEKESDEAWDWE